MAELDLPTLAQFVGLLLVAGALAGLMAGLLGVGGGMIIVPVLFYVFTVLDVEPAYRMHMAVGTSLATIVVTSVMSVRAHWRRESIDWSVIRGWGPWLVLGVVLGSVVAGRLDAGGLKIVFGVAALVVAAYMAFVKVEYALAKQPPQGPAKAVTASAIGGFSTLIGIGGGTFTVPVLIMSSVAPRIAVGTAAAVGVFIAIPAATGFVVIGWGAENLPPMSLGYVSIPAFLAIIPMTSLFAPIGARIAHSISPQWLKRAFAVFLLVNGTNILLSA